MAVSNACDDNTSHLAQTCIWRSDLLRLRAVDGRSAQQATLRIQRRDNLPLARPPTSLLLQVGPT